MSDHTTLNLKVGDKIVGLREYAHFSGEIIALDRNGPVGASILAVISTRTNPDAAEMPMWLTNGLSGINAWADAHFDPCPAWHDLKPGELCKVKTARDGWAPAIYAGEFDGVPHTWKTLPHPNGVKVPWEVVAPLTNAEMNDLGLVMAGV